MGGSPSVEIIPVRRSDSRLDRTVVGYGDFFGGGHRDTRLGWFPHLSRMCVYRRHFCVSCFGTVPISCRSGCE